MRMSKFSLATAAVLLTAVSTSTFAASNAELTITGNIVTSTCDVSVSTPTLDLGNHSKSAFTAVATPVTASVKTFTVGLNNCDSPSVEGDLANLVITGQTVAGNSSIFNSAGSASDSGVMLSVSGSPTTYLSQGEKIPVAVASSQPGAGDFNNKTVSFNAGLASTNISPNPGTVNAPILLSFVYN